MISFFKAALSFLLALLFMTSSLSMAFAEEPFSTTETQASEEEKPTEPLDLDTSAEAAPTAGDIALFGEDALLDVVYVSLDGNDANAGTATLPFLTLQKAVTAVNPGGKVFIAAGAYTLASVVRIDKNITLIGEGQSGGSTLQIEASGTYRHFYSATDDLALTLTDLALTGPGAEHSGGGVELGGVKNSLYMERCTISGCGSKLGGGVSAATVTLANCTIADNTAERHGGGVCASKTATLANCTIAGNTADEYGGGVWADTAATLTSCTITGNTAATGGGVIANGIVTLTNCTVVDNVAFKYCGGVYSNETAILTTCTVTGNTAGFMGAGLWTSKTPTLRGSIIAGNESAAGKDVCASNQHWEPTAPGPDNDYCIIGLYTERGEQITLADIFGTATPTLADNDGLTETILINPEGPALNAIPQSESWLRATDQRGLQRPQGEGGDIGAVELTYTALTLNVSDRSAGEIVNDMSGSYPEGKEIELEATPSLIYQFKEWTSSGEGSFSDDRSALTTFTMPNDDVSVQAEFEELGKELAQDDFGTFSGSGTTQARIALDMDTFTGRLVLVKGDGSYEDVPASDYSVTSGSTIITLQEGYLKGLANGTYEYVALFNDSYSPLTLKVEAASNVAGPLVGSASAHGTGIIPNTGDDPRVALLFLLAMGAVIVAATLFSCRWVRKRRMN